MDFIHHLRGYVMPVLLLLTLGFLALGALVATPFFWPLVVIAPLTCLGLYDLSQTTHSLWRNYPVIGRLRFMLEGAGPEMHQYFVESNTSGRPFNRDQRALMYRRAKNIEGLKPFGTESDVYHTGYGYIAQSMAPASAPDFPEKTLRVDVGGPDCKQPYSSSVLNVSAMSFGSLSANAIQALNTGASMGGFSHNTGEGGVSRYHKEPDGDLVWQVGTGYFGCRNPDGTFSGDMFSEQAALDQIRMIELKISQGAKPGHGGILPAAKVTREIAEARRVPEGEECVSPPGHSAFSTPIELMEFVAMLRERSGGKPVGFKLCIGTPREFLGICKAMVETGVTPDFITVDGGEGGTGAAPIEFTNSLGVPLREGLILVHNSLVGIGLRHRVRIAAAGKLISGYEMAAAMALGADFCNIARGFMFSMGCIQAQTCHTNHCPVGIATQNPTLQRALVVRDKAPRVCNFHRNTVRGLAEMAAACGYEHPNQFAPTRFFERISPHEIRRFDQLYDFLEPGQLLSGDVTPPNQDCLGRGKRVVVLARLNACALRESRDAFTQAPASSVSPFRECPILDPPLATTKENSCAD